MSNALENAKTLTAISTTDDPGSGGFWPNVTSAARIHRMRDRVFVGGGSAFNGNFAANGGGFVPTSTDGANWASRDSALFVGQDFGLMAITGFVSNENMNLTSGQPTESIAVSGFTINTQSTRTTWAGYLDIQHEAGVASYGIEIAAKNKSTDKTDTPYTTSGGVYGIWFAGGGDTAYGGSWTNPSNTAIKIGKNDPVGTTWNKGIVFVSDGLTGSDGTTSGAGNATAIELAYGHKIVWRAPGNFGGFEINCLVSGSGLNSSMLVGDGFVRFRGTGSASLFEMAHQTSAVNFLKLINRATGNGPRMTAEGETNVNIEVMSRGTGEARLLDGSAVPQIRVNSTGIGFYNTAPVAKPTGVAVSAAGIHAALVTLGLIAA